MAILDAAEQEFSSVGVHRASLEVIATRAGVSRSTLYRRFPGKEDLLIAVAARSAVGLSELLDARTRGLDAREAVVVAFVEAAAFIRENPMIRRLLVSEPEMLDLIVDSGHLGGGSLVDGVATMVSATLRRCGAHMPDADLHMLGDMLFRVLLSVVRTESAVVGIDDPEAIEHLATTLLAPLVH